VRSNTNIKAVHPTASSQAEWQGLINAMNEHTLFPLTNSWWTGGNIPSKQPQMLTYPAGIKLYEETCRATIPELKGFEVEYWDASSEQKGVEAAKENIKADKNALANGEVSLGV
jgi:hypothetical protein